MDMVLRVYVSNVQQLITTLTAILSPSRKLLLTVIQAWWQFLKQLQSQTHISVVEQGLFTRILISLRSLRSLAAL